MQRQLDANPELRASFDRNQVVFKPVGDGTYQPMSISECEGWVRSENAAGRIPVYEQFNRDIITVSAEQLEEITRQLDELHAAGQLTDEEFNRERADILAWGREHLATDQTKNNDGGNAKNEQALDAQQDLHPADGSSDKGGSTGGKTGESGSNGDATTGAGPGDNGDGPARPARGGDGPGGDGDRGRQPNRGHGPGGRGPGDGTAPARAGRRPGNLRPDTGQKPGSQGNVTGIGRTGSAPGDPPRVPITERTGAGGIPYRDGLHASADSRGDPGVDASTSPDSAGKPGAATATWWDTVVKWSGYLNFTFSDDSDDEDRAEGGVPGGLGLLGLHGTGWQILYVLTTIVSTIAALYSLVKSIAIGGLRALLSNIWKALRSPIQAIKELWAAVKAFGGETARAAKWLWGSIGRAAQVWRDTGSVRELLAEMFKLGGRSNATSGPLSWLARLFKGKERWNTEQQFRDGASWLFKQRWFGKLPWYNAEHLATQSGAANAAAAAVRNGYWNTFLRLPSAFNSSLQNRILPRVIFYSGAAAALIKSAFAGLWGGQAIVDRAVGPTPATP